MMAVNLAKKRPSFITRATPEAGWGETGAFIHDPRICVTQVKFYAIL